EEMPDGRRQGRDEGRNAARVLSERVPACVREDAGEVVRLVGQRRERRAHDRLGRLVDDREDAGPEHFETDGVEARAHDSVTMMLPLGATRAVASSPITSVEPSSSTTAPTVGSAPAPATTPWGRRGAT